RRDSEADIFAQIDRAVLAVEFAAENVIDAHGIEPGAGQGAEGHSGHHRHRRVPGRVAAAERVRTEWRGVNRSRRGRRRQYRQTPSRCACHLSTPWAPTGYERSELDE